MTEQQIPVIVARLVEHQSEFSLMSTEDAQWVIQNTKPAITLFVEAINNRSKDTPESVERIRVINNTTIIVNLGATPKLPFNGAEVESHIGEGWAIVEKKVDGLYVNGRKVILYLSKKQQNSGGELCEKLRGKPVLNANILDALADNPHLIPEDWKRDENNNTRFIFFWATIYRGADGRLCVRCLCFSDAGLWHRRCYWLGFDWGDDNPAALLASI